jgi:hypothetical protein
VIQPKKGDPVVLVFTGAVDDHGPKIRNVTSSGRKYFTIGGTIRFPIGCDEGQRNMVGGGGDGLGDVEVWSSIEAIAERLRKSNLVCEIGKMIKYDSRVMMRQPVANLEKALTLIGGKLE